MKKVLFAVLFCLAGFLAQAQTITVHNYTTGTFNYQIDANSSLGGGSSGVYAISPSATQTFTASSFTWSGGTPAVYTLFTITTWDPCPIGQNCVIGSGGLNCFRLGDPAYGYPDQGYVNINSSCNTSVSVFKMKITVLPSGDIDIVLV
jgi:hypothetical protein